MKEERKGGGWERNRGRDGGREGRKEGGEKRGITQVLLMLK